MLTLLLAAKQIWVITLVIGPDAGRVSPGHGTGGAEYFPEGAILIPIGSDGMARSWLVSLFKVPHGFLDQLTLSPSFQKMAFVSDGKRGIKLFQESLMSAWDRTSCLRRGR